MISLHILKPNFNLIDKGFHYFRVMKYMLDISSPKSTSLRYLALALTLAHSKLVSHCSFVSDFKVSI
jgi:hypothetical protein